MGNLSVEAGRERIQVQPLSRAVGAEVVGVDLSQDVSDIIVDEIRQALGEYGVLLFRDQNLSPEDHVEFARKFGPINVNKYFHPVEGHPEIAKVIRRPEEKGVTGGYWHTDHSYDQTPAMGSVFVAREIPPVGGDTLFAGMFAAYDALSDGLKSVLERLWAWHSDAVCPEVGDPSMHEDFNGRLKLVQANCVWAKHPVVIRHPISGQKALYVNKGFTHSIDGWYLEESRMLLEFLFEHGSSLGFTYRHRWKAGDVAFWDNRATWHRAMDDTEGYLRVLHRITIDGEPLSAAADTA